ncbi:hypothetical protein D0862_02612 [Hortaea werneckii]|uniref:Phosphogluconate dehydrogenase NAD-binding putative C-terminal domain-containing protein n=1 Tax=Hortaea werneckii TaxID=91943 RepID=A0A3M7HH18_HORWE|nr:hypothetical protein D0862_02612 [Hortaea werneckii]
MDIPQATPLHASMQWTDSGSGKNSAISSPVSPLPVRDLMSGQSPVIQTLHDNKQWVDLDYLSPKLIRELCRQYDPPPESDSASTISKGAAKVRAWARHSKLGIDIRLRRKLNLEHDEVTDIRLIPEPRPVPREKPAPVAELPGQPHEIQELPDNPRARELACPPARGFSNSSLDESADPLPKYEPKSSSGNGTSFGCHATAPDTESRSAFRATYSSTPDRALSPPGTRFNSTADGETLDGIQKRVHTNTDLGNLSSSSAELRALHFKLEQVNERLDQERSAKERFEKLLADVRRELASERDASRNERETSSTNPFLDGLRVSNTASYETQTGVAPPSPDINEKTLLTTLRQSRALAAEILGSGHSRVEAFSRDLLTAENSFEQAADNDQHEDLLQNPSQTGETTYDQSSSLQARAQFRRGRAQQKTNLPVLKTTFHSMTKDPSPTLESAIEAPTADPWITQATQDRARRNGVELLSDDIELCNIADYILSIVPPRDAFATAKRIVTATESAKYQSRANPLYYLDLNAISPQSSREINEILKTSQSSVKLIDGGIIGAPPRQSEDGSWYRPSIPLSGPESLTSFSPSGSNLAKILNTSHVGPEIGSATGLKMCFAALTKGFTALAIESLTTAHNLGCLAELKRHLEDFNPGAAKAINSLTTMPPKAYRWEREMEEIARTFEADGGFAEDENLGAEKVESRVRGKSVEDVALLMAEGTAKRKEKVE